MLLYIHNVKDKNAQRTYVTIKLSRQVHHCYYVTNYKQSNKMHDAMLHTLSRNQEYG